MLFLVMTLFDPSEYSGSIQKHFDYDHMTFKCFNQDKKISVDSLNDHICDCCDGSDEFIDPTFKCNNTCQHQLSQRDKKRLADVFRRAIIKRSGYSTTAQLLYNEITKNLTEASDILANLYKSKDISYENKKSAKKALKEFLYKHYGYKIPTEEQLKREKEEFINHKLEKLTKHVSDDEEMGEDDAVYQVDDEIIRKARQIQEYKWIDLQKAKFNKLLEKYISERRADRPSDFMGKLKAMQDFPEHENWINAKNEYKRINYNITEYKTQCDEYLRRINSDNSTDHIWQTIFGHVHEGKVSNTYASYKIIFFQAASATHRSGFADFGIFKKLTNDLMIFGHKNPNPVQHTLRLRLICYPEIHTLEALQKTRTHLDILLGLPHVCPSVFDNNLFEQWLREIQYYQEQVLQNSVFNDL